MSIPYFCSHLASSPFSFPLSPAPPPPPPPPPPPLPRTWSNLVSAVENMSCYMRTLVLVMTRRTDPNCCIHSQHTPSSSTLSCETKSFWFMFVGQAKGLIWDHVRRARYAHAQTGTYLFEFFVRSEATSCGVLSWVLKSSDNRAWGQVSHLVAFFHLAGPLVS